MTSTKKQMKDSKKYMTPLKGDTKGYKRAKSEIFIGLVGATGSDLNTVEKYIEEILSQFDYNNPQRIKFSDFFVEPYFEKYIKKTKKKVDPSKRFDEVLGQMEMGKEIRENSEDFSILAKYAVQKVHKMRKLENLENQENGNFYIFHSLKHPSEAKLLSEIYGVGYYQIGVYSDENQRVLYLKENKNIDRAKAYELIDKDIGEDSEGGQQTRNTFQSSDFFIRHNHDRSIETELQLERIFDLIFGHPYITPTIDEHMMYMAYSYATRSADLSRQVGAVLSNKFGDIIGLGSNDVPCAGGGPYWPSPKQNNSQDWRDYRKGEDPNEKMKNEIKEKMIISIMKTVKEMKAMKENENEKELLKEGLKNFKHAINLNDITEFARATHAEMSAILHCVRNGTSPRGGILYCTTFPCHNCAKHIVDSGIEKVLFVEPYPKSKAQDLHNDSISFPTLDKREDGDRKVVIFDHFIGVAARRYLDLFSLKLGMGREIHRKEKGKVTNFERKNASIRTPLVFSSYLEKEQSKIDEL